LDSTDGFLSDLELASTALDYILKRAEFFLSSMIAAQRGFVDHAFSFEFPLRGFEILLFPY
jgi:hypothetical protein